MPQKKGMLFIDANIYLELFIRISGRKLLARLVEQSEHVFITQQIVNEVQRRKMKIVCESLTLNVNTINLNGAGIPNQFFKADSDEESSISDHMKSLRQDVDKLKTEINEHYSAIINKIDESTDEVSVGLNSIFRNAIDSKPEERKRARLRKELGNPPGKPGDPLGDELSWEQVLSNINDATHLWVITKDKDYWNEFNKKSYLNSFLKSEILQVNPQINIYVFKELVKGLDDFGRKMGTDVLKGLSANDLKEIENEEKSGNMLKFSQSALARKYLEDNDPSALARKYLEENDPSALVQKYLEENDPSALARKYLEENDPSALVQKYLEENDPSALVQKYLEDNDHLSRLKKSLEDDDHEPETEE